MVHNGYSFFGLQLFVLFLLDLDNRVSGFFEEPVHHRFLTSLPSIVHFLPIEEEVQGWEASHSIFLTRLFLHCGIHFCQPHYTKLGQVPTES